MNDRPKKYFVMMKDLKTSVITSTKFSYFEPEAIKLKRAAATTFPDVEFWLKEDEEDEDEQA